MNIGIFTKLVTLVIKEEKKHFRNTVKVFFSQAYEEYIPL